MKKLLFVAALGTIAACSFGQFFPLDSLVVVQTTTGAGIAGAAAQTNLVGYDYAGVSNGKNFDLTAGGGITLINNSSSEGIMNASAGFIAVGGYSSAANTAAPSGIAAARRVAVFNNAGAGSVSFVDIAATGTAMRSAYTQDGTNLLTATSAGGWRTQTGATPTSLGGSTTSNTRTVKIIGGTIYGSTASASGAFSGTGTGIYSLTAGAQTFIQGTSSSSGTADANTADFEFIKDGTGFTQDYVLVAGTGGLKIYKGFQASATPTNLLTTISTATTIQNIAVRNWDVAGLKKVTIYASSLTKLYATTFDAGNIEAGGFSFTEIGTAAAGTTYRGIDVVPEPASMAVLGIGLAGLAARRRRK